MDNFSILVDSSRWKKSDWWVRTSDFCYQLWNFCWFWSWTWKFQLPDYDWIIKNIHCIKVAIFGHSYVNNLKHFYTTETNPKLQIEFFEISGGKISAPIHRKGRWIHLHGNSITADWRRFQPDLTILMFGGNDITNETDPQNLVTAFQDLCENQQWPTEFIITSIEPHSQVCENQVSLRNYETIKTKTNEQLASTFKRAFWNLEALWAAEESRRIDGIHLTNACNRILAASMKNKNRTTHELFIIERQIKIDTIVRRQNQLLKGNYKTHKPSK